MYSKESQKRNNHHVDIDMRYGASGLFSYVNGEQLSEDEYGKSNKVSVVYG